ncbi:hypothetical protein BMS3Bbin10_02252 [bacterium BMS3Bbin10]|nr:hypothetical protein BMS3Bbin10_02252 [bacterium BMS3Bbin10]
MTKTDSKPERFPWAGPALFIIVLVLLIAFFWWFVQA